jgi:hypothetical protein
LALGQIGDARAVEPLLECMSRQNHDFSAGSEQGIAGAMVFLEAIGRLGDPRAVSRLVDLLWGQIGNGRPDSWGPVIRFLRTAGLRGDPRAIEHLIDLLGNLGDDAKATDGALVSIGATAVEPLINAFGAASYRSRVTWPEPQIARTRVARVLGRIGGERAAGTLARKREDGSTWIYGCSPIKIVNDVLRTHFDERYETLQGLIWSSLQSQRGGGPPEVGEEAHAEGYAMRVEEMDYSIITGVAVRSETQHPAV